MNKDDDIIDSFWSENFFIWVNNDIEKLIQLFEYRKQFKYNNLKKLLYR